MTPKTQWPSAWTHRGNSCNAIGRVLRFRIPMRLPLTQLAAFRCARKCRCQRTLFVGTPRQSKVSSDGAWRGLRVRMGLHSGRPTSVTKHEEGCCLKSPLLHELCRLEEDVPECRVVWFWMSAYAKLRKSSAGHVPLQVTGRWRYAGPSVAMAKAIEARRR